jgi:ribosomal protein L7/L12
MYEITEYSKIRASKLGVDIKPSTNKNKKIDVYKEGKKITSIGARKENGTFYKDYPTYVKEKGKAYADERRKLYKQRHEKNRTKFGSRSWYADKILW